MCHKIKSLELCFGVWNSFTIVSARESDSMKSGEVTQWIQMLSKESNSNLQTIFGSFPWYNYDFYDDLSSLSFARLRKRQHEARSTFSYHHRSAFSNRSRVGGIERINAPLNCWRMKWKLCNFELDFAFQILQKFEKYFKPVILNICAAIQKWDIYNYEIFNERISWCSISQKRLRITASTHFEFPCKMLQNFWVVKPS